jgi:hypothetical protein
MKSPPRLLFFLFVCFASMIQPLLDRIVPADFKGDGEFGERGQYLMIELRAGGLRKTETGAWSWDWLMYRRTLTIAAVPGVSYRQEGWVTLGAPPKGAK